MFIMISDCLVTFSFLKSAEITDTKYDFEAWNANFPKKGENETKGDQDPAYYQCQGQKILLEGQWWNASRKLTKWQASDTPI